MKTILILVLNLLIQGTKAECDAGSFIDATDNDECKLCAIGTYQNSIDQSSCKDCTNCNSLGKAYQCTVEGAIASCANCPTGFYNDVVNHQQICKECTTTCAKGKQQECIATAGDLCIDCDSGMYQDEAGHTQTDCKNCANGQTNAPNFRSCINTCVPGKYKDSNTCKDCPSGRYSIINDVLACEECGAGTLYINAETFCPSCPTGQYQQQADQSNTACKTCGKGKVAADGRGIGGCKSCIAGKYQDLNQATIFSLSGQFTGGKGECLECVSPALFDAINKPCTGCSSGKYTTSTNACVNCQIGRYQNQVGQSYCKLCDPGGSGLAAGYQDQLGQTSCIACTSACVLGDTLARPCEASHDLECIGCETGKYRGSGGSCLFCAAGKGMDWSSPTTFCTACVAGTYQPSSEKLSAVCISCLPGLTGEPGRSSQCVTKKKCSDDASITCADKFNSRFCGTEAEPCNAMFCCRQPCPVDTATTSETPYQCLCNTPAETTPELCDIGEFCTTRTSATIRTSAFCSKSSHIDIDFPHSPDCKPLKLLASGEWVADTAATSTCQCWQGEVAPFQIAYDKTSVKCTTNTCSTQCVDATHCNSKYGHCVDPDYCSSFNGVAELDIQTGCRCQLPSTYLTSSSIYDEALLTPYSCQSGQKYCRAKLADSEKCSDIAITNCKNKVGLFKNELPDEDGGKYCGCGISGLCTEEEPYCVGAISLCSAAPGTPCNNIYGNHINPEPCACSALDSFGAAIGIPDPCGANMYCDTGVCSEAKCPTTGLCTNNHIETTEGTFHFEGYIPNAKCITEECDENSDILSCCERCHEWNEAAGRCGTSCPEFFDCKLIPSMTGFVRPPGNYRYETAELVSWEIERFNTGKFDDVCVDGCSETNVANVETCCLAVDTCAEHHQNNLCVNTDNFADPSEVGSWDGSKQCEGHICRPEECCDFISCTCENGNAAFPPQCINNTNVCQETCDIDYFKINATHCFPGTICAVDEYVYQIPNLVFDTRCKLRTECQSTEYIVADAVDATVNATGNDTICDILTNCDYTTQFLEQDYTLYTDRVCTNVTVCNTLTHFELTPATETTNRVCTELSAPCDFEAGEYIAQANNLTHDRICLNIDFADCATTEYMFQDYSETQNRICEPLTVCNTVTNPTGTTAAAPSAPPPVTPPVTPAVTPPVTPPDSDIDGVEYDDSTDYGLPNEQIDGDNFDNFDNFDGESALANAVSTLATELATEYISVNETIDSDRSCSNLIECDFTQQYIRILATDYTDRKCSALRECSGFEFISVNETTTSNRVCTPLSKCPVTEYAAPQDTTYFDRVCSTCEADGLTTDGATCLGCMTEGNCKYDQSALVQDDASCFSEQCTTYTLNNINMTFTNDSGTYDMNEIVLINDNWVRFDVIGGVEPNITITGDVEKVYNDLNELVYLYFQVPVTVEDFNATLNDTNFLLRQNCVVTILLEDKCVSDPLVDLCDSNYTRPGQQAIWWEIQYHPLEGGEACPGNGDPIDPYYIDCANSDCERDCNETCASIWSDCLTVTGVNVTCGEEGNRTKNCIVHSTPQNGGKECTPSLTESCVGAIPTPYCDCDGHILDSCVECNGGSILAVPRHSSGCCPIGTVQDVCGICNGTGICPNLKQREIMERQVSHDKSVFEKYGLIVIVTLLVPVCFAGLLFLCYSGWCNTQYEYEDLWYARIKQWDAPKTNRDEMKVTAKEINEYKEYFRNKNESYQIINKVGEETTLLQKDRLFY